MIIVSLQSFFDYNYEIIEWEDDIEYILPISWFKSI